MADIFEQAGAIWKTLDELLEKDPEGYKRFIKEHIEGGEDFFKSQGSKAGKNQQGSSNVKSGSQISGKDVGVESVLKQFATLELGLVGQTEPIIKREMKDSTQVKQSQSKAKTEEKKNSLLNDNIGNSVIASIVSMEKRLDDTENVELEKDSIPEEIKIDLTNNVPKRPSGKQLIEEL